jgi:RimJ/RimL family protein N-acetyltransferase
VCLPASPTLTTERLTLRGFVDSDLEPLAAMNANPEVMRYLGGVRSSEWSAASIDRCRDQWRELGFGRFAIEDNANGEFVGWVTLEPVELDGYVDDIEIGWRLVRAFWGRGLATEAATAALTWAFASLPADRILAVADAENALSVSVMRRLGMVHLADVPDKGRTSTVWCTPRPLRAADPD